MDGHGDHRDRNDYRGHWWIFRQFPGPLERRRPHVDRCYGLAAEPDCPPVALRPPSLTRTFGLYRMEILAALINGATLILIAIFILYEAYQRFRSPVVVDTRIMLLVAAVGLVANGLAAWAMMRANKENLNIRGAYLHILGDAFSSLGVIGGAWLSILRVGPLWTPSSAWESAW